MCIVVDMIRIYSFITLGLCMLLSSCNGINKKSDSQEEVSDTIVMEDTIPTPIVYPDTILASALDNINFTIDTMLHHIDGTISDYSDLYASAQGIFTFRGGPARTPNFAGRITGTPTKVTQAWMFETDYDTRQTDFGMWGGGTGWTGQPLYINWNNEQIEHIRNNAAGYITDEFAAEEILVGSLCGKVHFINLATGKASRRPYEIGNPIKGTMSFDPTMNGNLYVGQGVPAERPFGAMVINLYNHTTVSFQAEDAKAWRRWGAYDSSPIRVGDFMFRLGENGTIYKIYCKGDSVLLHSTLRYRINGAAPGIESSIAISRNYGFFSDNHGNVIAINLNTLQPVWRYKNVDDSDASVVVEEIDGIPYVYTGCEIDKQGDRGHSHFVKLNGLTGELIWSATIAGNKKPMGGKTFDGGMFATPLIGVGDCEGMIFSNFSIQESGNMGALIAFNKEDGQEIYRTKTHHYSWSSPIAMFNENNEMYIITGDTNGYIYLIKGKTGEVIYKEDFANNFESSPIAIGNQIVVGSRGREIYKFIVE